MNKLSNKNKKLTIVILDISIGILVEIWASKSYPDKELIIIISFFILLSARLLIDFYLNTIEDEFYDLHIQSEILEMKRKLEIQEQIKDEMKLALRNGNIDLYERYSKVNKDL